ncbi:hypothetical protein IAR55_006662 [Kwoniella newhampshirensis]|uniref:U1-type domain-containing protein n=1 Tax=Kwoniella newhampshirensis TaxID=1651941 RepID=A0AAW0YTL5_9TREE
MPLYKLTEKRLKKREWEDETGITALKSKMREMGEGSSAGSGSGDEWSDESESDSDGDEGDSGSDDDDEEDQEGSEDESESEDGELDSEAAEDFDDGSSEAESVVGKRKRAISISDKSDASDDFSITVETALENPVYSVGETQLCVLCPGKVLKNDHIVKTHLESNAHKRAAKRFFARITANPPPPGSDPREIVDEILDQLEDGIPTPATTPTVSTKAPKDRNISKADRPKSSKERKELKAKSMLEKKTSDGTNEILDESKLNRKARRLLAAQQKGGEGEKKTTDLTETKKEGEGKGKSTKAKKQKVA